MESLWHATTAVPHFDSLRKSLRTQVLIIGGGLTGLLCAYKLEQAGVDCVVLEADTVCGGTTGNTTAKITSQHGLIYDKLTREFSANTARQYYRANEAALDDYRTLCADIDCGFEQCDAFVYTLGSGKKIEKELAALKTIGAKADFVADLPLPFGTAGAVRFPAQAQFEPLKFISAICKNLKIYEHTPVREIIAATALTQFGRVTADKIIVATHFPFINKHGVYFLKMYQHRSYVIALENAQQVEGMYVDEAKKGLSFRNCGDYLLIGGGDHRTGKKGGAWQELRDFAAKYYPDAKEKYHWAAQDCMTLDGVPYIGAYSPKTPNLYVATGFNKWGMTSAMAAATLLTDLVRGRRNEYEQLFSPSRTLMRPQLAANSCEALAGLLTPTVRRCPHLGCALKWNKYEHTWDCPCHGSRFDKDGMLLENPATDNLK